MTSCPYQGPTELIRRLFPLICTIFRPFSWILAKAFVLSSRETAALVRTTMAIVRISSGVSENVLPQTGTVLVNLRSHPGVCSVVSSRCEHTTL